MPYYSPEAVGVDRSGLDAPNRQISAKIGHIIWTGGSIVSVISSQMRILGRHLSVVKQR
jgi:hypothetical protein